MPYPCPEQADLTEGWVPEKPIYFFHFDGDLVVPYANSLPIKEKIASGEWSTAKFIDTQTAYNSLPNAWNLAIGLQDSAMKGSDADHVAQWNHVNCGTLFYIWFMAGCPNNGTNLRETQN